MFNNPEKDEQMIPKGDETILLIDDEPGLVEAGALMLELLGYTVVAVTDALDALHAFRLKPQGFDLVIMDMLMPRMTGVELAGELQKIRPDIPVILCTGMLDADEEEIAGLNGFREVLSKPVFLRDMALSVRRVLDGKEGYGREMRGAS